MAINPEYLGPGGGSGGGRGAKYKPPRAAKAVGSFRNAPTLPSGALVSNPSGPTTIGIRGTRILPTVQRTASLLPEPYMGGDPLNYTSTGTTFIDWAAIRRQNEGERKEAYQRWRQQQIDRREIERRAAIRRNYYSDPARFPAPTVQQSQGARRPTRTITDPSLMTGAVSYSRRPAQSFGAMARRDKVRRERQYWAETADAWKANYPAQSKIIDQIIAIEQMPERTMADVEAKKLAFSSVNAKGAVAELLNYYATGFWRMPSEDRPITGERRMRAVDTMQRGDRFAKVYAMTDDPESFGLTQMDIAEMISAGIITYGKTDADGYRVPVSTMNIAALDAFLNDNFVFNDDNTYERRYNSFVFSDSFKTLASGSVARYDYGVLNMCSPNVWINPNTAGTSMVDIPRLGDGRPDYRQMRVEYERDEANYADLRGRIEEHIRGNGGGPLLERLYSGRFDATDVQNLRKFMYDPDGPYGNYQERWLAETFFNFTPADWADEAVMRREQEKMGDLVEQNEKRREDERKAEQELAASTAEANFRYRDENTGQVVNVIPVSQWPRALAAILDEGVGGTVPRDILNEIFFEDVQAGTRRELSEEDKQLLYVAAIEAANAGAPIDPFILKMVQAWENDISEADVASAMAEREADGRSWWQRTVNTGIGSFLFDNPSMGLINRGWAGAALAAGDDMTIQEGLAKAFKTDSASLAREFTVGRVAQMMTDPKGPLSPEKTDTVFSAAFVDNFFKSPIRAALGMPMGFYYAFTDPLGTGKAILEDYGQRYGAIWGDPDSNFIESSLMDPWAPALDIMGLVPVVGFGARAAQAGRIASTVARVNKGNWDSAMADATYRAPYRPAKFSLRPAREVSLDEADNLVSGRVADSYDPKYGANIRAEGLRKLEALAGGKDRPVRFVNAWKFANAQRQALNGDMAAYTRLVGVLPDGVAGLNSAYTPHLMDKVASWFSPRWVAFSMKDVIPEGTPDEAAEVTRALSDDRLREMAARRGISPEQLETLDVMGGPLRRLSGNPFARGLQELTFMVQKGIAKRSPGGPLVNLPLVGFNFRYVNALKLNPYGALDYLQRELHQQALAEGMANAYNFSEAEQLAIMSSASGGMYSQPHLLSIALQDLERLRTAGIDEADPTMQLVIDRVKMLERPEFEEEYVRTMKDLYTIGEDGLPLSARGKQMRKVADDLRRRTELMRHEAGVELDALSTRELVTRYQLFLNASRLNPEQILESLDAGTPEDAVPLSKRVAPLNGGYHFLETSKIDDIPDEDGNNFRSVMNAIEDMEAAPEVYKAIIEKIRKSVDYMAQDTFYRNMDKVPLFVVDRVETVGGRKFVYGRRLRVEGEFDRDSGATTRTQNIVDDTELVLPVEAFYKAKNGNRHTRIDDDSFVLTYSTKDKSASERGIDPDLSELEEQLTRASLNLAMKLFPSARDFADKVHHKTMMDSKETFKQAANRNIIASSALVDFKLQTHFAALRNAAYRRFNVDIEETLADNAIFITREQAEKYPNAYRVLKTVALHDTREAAQKYIEATRAGSTSADPQIIEHIVNGEKKFVTRMSFIDSVAFGLREARKNDITPVSEWEKAVYTTLDNIDFNNANRLIAVVPRSVADDLADSYNRSRNYAIRALGGFTSAFKLMALSLNPRFVTQQFFGTMVLMMLANPMQSGHILARFFQYAINKQTRRYLKHHGGSWKAHDIDVNPYQNHGDDFDIIYNRFIREMEDQVYGQDAEDFINGKARGAKMQFVKRAASAGYLFSMAIEKNFRVAVIREAAMAYPGFKDFMNTNPDVARRALEGIPDMGYNTVTKFHAAMDMLSDPTNTKYYDPRFLNELRHTADMVSGNYRDFRNTERWVRDLAVPFYAWSRHSALYTKRLVQERPLTANSLYNIGNYGYERVAAAGGLPDWLLESIPMPEVVAEVLGLDPEKDNRLGFGLINPFGTFARNIQAGLDLARGGPFSGSQGVFEVTNPLIELLVEQSTGRSLLTGAPTDPNETLLGALGGMANTLPPIKILTGLFRTSAQLNELRGMTDPADILKDPYGRTPRLDVPRPKFNTKFPTLSRAGFVSSSIVPVYSLDPEQLGNQVAREYEERGVLYDDFKLKDQRKQLKTANALRNWAYKRDYVLNVWMPAFAAENPELATLVLAALEREKPSIPKGFRPESVEAILSGSLQ